MNVTMSSQFFFSSDIIGLIKFEYAWILTREQRPSAEVV